MNVNARHNSIKVWPHLVLIFAAFAALGAGAAALRMRHAPTPNTPLTTGARLYARDGSRASLAFTGHNYATIDPDSALDVVSLSDRRTQLALREGSAIFDIGELAPGELFEVATPYGAVDFNEPGLYQVGYNAHGTPFLSA